MTSRVGTGWQTIIADLSLILFMIAASSLSRQPDHPGAPPPSRASPVAQRAAPFAVWIAGAGAPPLAQWLAQQPRDGRQQVTVSATYPPGGMEPALARSRVLAAQAGEGARIVVEPGAADLRVVIAFDAPGARLARRLRPAEDTPSPGEHP